MAKWKCEICGNEFENFHAQGFDNKIYCPLCYFKKENKELKKQLENKYSRTGALTNEVLYEENTKLINQQKEFIEYLEKTIVDSKAGSGQQYYYQQVLEMYKEIIGVSDENKTNV